MSEFIIDATDAQLKEKFDARAFFGPRLKEEIVRCAECRHSTGGGMYCWIFSHYETMGEGDYQQMPAVVKPDGFCWNGERRIIT